MTQNNAPTEDTAILLESISAFYRIRPNRPTSLKEYVIRWIQGDLRADYLKAVDQLSFQIMKGEVFGIIGRNGAGKTTLLKVISGILHPTEGRVRVWGHVVSLLGVGAGFHFELTGRENIYLYSAILGRSQRKTEELYPEIVEFSELGDFIDSPLRMYSTGMIARLGFAVAMADTPDVLLVDEVLGVGDEQFQAKCKARFEEFAGSGTTVVIVSHSMNAVREMCGRAVWLRAGKVAAIGEADHVADLYQENYKSGLDEKRLLRSESD